MQQIETYYQKNENIIRHFSILGWTRHTLNMWTWGTSNYASRVSCCFGQVDVKLKPQTWRCKENFLQREFVMKEFR